MGIEELRRLSVADRSDSYRVTKREQQAIVRRLADAASMLEPGDTASYWPETLVQGNRRWLRDELTPDHIESVLQRLGVSVTCSVVSIDLETETRPDPETDSRPVVLITAK